MPIRHARRSANHPADAVRSDPLEAEHRKAGAAEEQVAAQWATVRRAMKDWAI